MERKLIRRGDLLLILLLLLAALILILSSRGPAREDVTAIIYNHGAEIARIPLQEVRETYNIAIDCIPALTVRVEPGSISFSHAECKDQICVRSGALSRPGQMAVCLPAGVSIRLAGTGTEDGPDAVTY